MTHSFPTRRSSDLIALPKGVELNVQAESVSVKGPKGTLSIAKSADIDVKIENGQAQLSTGDAEKVAIPGTLRAIIANMVHGVSEGFERKLDMVGVGYRAALPGKDLHMSLGFSHPVLFRSEERRAGKECGRACSSR